MFALPLARVAGLVPRHVPFSLTDEITIAGIKSQPSVCFGFPWRASFVSTVSAQGDPYALLNPRVLSRCSSSWSQKEVSTHAEDFHPLGLPAGGSLLLKPSNGTCRAGRARLTWAILRAQREGETSAAPGRRGGPGGLPRTWGWYGRRGQRRSGLGAVGWARVEVFRRRIVWDPAPAARSLQLAWAVGMSSLAATSPGGLTSWKTGF